VTRAKICGITRLEDAELAAAHGAWAIGFILWPGSKRLCDPAMAAGIARRMRRRVELVGVFVNATLDEVVQAADAIGLTHLQLHGNEGPAYCAAAGQRTGCKVIKAHRIATGADVLDLERFHTDFHLLDAAARGFQGGSGQTWDWSLFAQRRSAVPAILSGGLTPGNVVEAIESVRPWGVDVASGVEAEPGIKDPAKVEAFLAAVGSVGARA
jgi:phosphoribosylanthranilate isomerase